MLRTEPSFSIYSADDKVAEDGENEDLIRQKLERSAKIGETIETQFSFGPMNIIEEEEDDDEEEEGAASNRFKGLKIELGGGDYVSSPQDAAAEFGLLKPDHDGDLDEYYSRMVGQEPSNPVVLRDYAQYLKSKRDFYGAEEYYYRATLADPKDGEALSQYAKLVWELHGDQSRASSYFERAIVAAPGDSDVLAAYASFQWDTDETEEEEGSSITQVDENYVQVDHLPAKDFVEEKRPSSPSLHLAMGLGINVDGFGGSNNSVEYISIHSDESTTVEEHHRRMVEENPSNPLLLRDYAQFLHQSKGDLHGAEEYNSRAILEDPNDGEILSLYASIVWQLHRDKDRAVDYFERAVQATPEDSYVLAAYAKFLWETESEEEMS